MLCIKPKLCEKVGSTGQRAREQTVNLDFATSIDTVSSAATWASMMPNTEPAIRLVPL